MTIGLFGVEDGYGWRWLRAWRVVVGDNDVHPLFGSVLHLLGRASATVYRQYQLDVLFGQFVERIGVQAIALVDAVGNIGTGIPLQRA